MSSHWPKWPDLPRRPYSLEGLNNPPLLGRRWCHTCGRWRHVCDFRPRGAVYQKACEACMRARHRIRRGKDARRPRGAATDPSVLIRKHRAEDPIYDEQYRERLRFNAEKRRRASGQVERQWGPNARRLPQHGSTLRESLPAGPFLGWWERTRIERDLTEREVAQAIGLTSGRTFHRIRATGRVSLHFVDRVLVILGELPDTLNRLYPIEEYPLEAYLPELDRALARRDAEKEVA